MEKQGIMNCYKMIIYLIGNKNIEGIIFYEF